MFLDILYFIRYFVRFAKHGQVSCCFFLILLSQTLFDSVVDSFFYSDSIQVVGFLPLCFLLFPFRDERQHSGERAALLIRMSTNTGTLTLGPYGVFKFKCLLYISSQILCCVFARDFTELQ